jgi:hypothetical protein
LEAATAAIPGPVTHRWFDSKDHALRGVDDHVARLVVDWLAEHGLVGRGGASLR